MKSYFIYIACCKDGSLYTGYAVDVEKRIQLHNRGEGAKYTRSRLPITLVYQETHESRGSAMSREQEIKRLSRKKKLELIGENFLLV